MRERTFFLAVLVFGLAIVGCDNGSTGEVDTWSNITDFNQMNGTWKSFYSQNDRPIKDVAEEMELPWDSTMETMAGDIRVTTRADITITIDANAKTQATAVISTTTFSGGSIGILWLFIKPTPEELEKLNEEGVTVTFNDANHSVSTAYDNPAEPLSDEDIAEMLNSGMQINQSGTKIWMPAGSITEGMPELIFDKQ